MVAFAAMPVITCSQVTEAEYLKALYRPDCDFIDGELRERNVGQKDHSKLQGKLFVWLYAQASRHGIAVYLEMRLRIAEGRYRVPDLCVAKLPEPDEQIFTSPPYIVIEVLSPEDSLRRMQERFDDYLAMGVENIWVLDPETLRGWTVTELGHLEARDLIFRTVDQALVMPLSEVLSEAR